MDLSLLYVLLKTNGGGVSQLCSNTVKITDVLSNLSAGRHFITDRRLGKALEVFAHMHIPPISFAQTHLDVSVHFAFVVQVVQAL